MRVTGVFSASVAIAASLVGARPAIGELRQLCLTPTALTDNDTHDVEARIDGNVIVWEGDDGIYRWDGSTSSKVAGTSATSEYPDVSGSLVAWNDRDGSVTNDNEIYLWDADLPAPPAPLTSNEVDDQFARISGSNVVWHSPDYPGATSIHLWNGTSVSELTDADGGAIDRLPAISGGTVVWEGGPASLLYRWDGAGEAPLTALSGVNINVAIDGARIVWEHRPSVGLFDIWMWDGTEIVPITGSPNNNDRSPDVWEDRVVWSMLDGHDWEIMLWDGATGTTYQLTCNAEDDYGPRISGRRVVWSQGNGSDVDYEVMTLVIPEIQSLPALNPWAMLVLVVALIAVAVAGSRRVAPSSR
jgi:hypothetical protein